jgi:hypothetical protein
MIADALAGKSDYFAPMWGEAVVEAMQKSMLSRFFLR